MDTGERPGTSAPFRSFIGAHFSRNPSCASRSLSVETLRSRCLRVQSVTADFLSYLSLRGRGKEGEGNSRRSKHHRGSLTAECQQLVFKFWFRARRVRNCCIKRLYCTNSKIVLEGVRWRGDVAGNAFLTASRLLGARIIRLKRGIR